MPKRKSTGAEQQPSNDKMAIDGEDDSGTDDVLPRSFSQAQGEY